MWSVNRATTTSSYHNFELTHFIYSYLSVYFSDWPWMFVVAGDGSGKHPSGLHLHHEEDAEDVRAGVVSGDGPGCPRAGVLYRGWRDPHRRTQLPHPGQEAPSGERGVFFLLRMTANLENEPAKLRSESLEWLGKIEMTPKSLEWLYKIIVKNLEKYNWEWLRKIRNESAKLRKLRKTLQHWEWTGKTKHNSAKLIMIQQN